MSSTKNVKTYKKIVSKTKRLFRDKTGEQPIQATPPNFSAVDQRYVDPIAPVGTEKHLTNDAKKHRF